VRDEVDGLVQRWVAAGMPREDIARLALSKRVARLAVRHEQAIKAELTDLGLTYAEFDVLVALSRVDGPLRPRELARGLFLTSGGTSNVLNRLTAAGYVAREPDPDDARGTRVTLTDEGRAVTERALAASVRGHADLFAGISTEDLQAAADALRPVVVAIERRRRR
jgi:DNA-binding MarR family transcriptional regulator